MTPRQQGASSRALALSLCSVVCATLCGRALSAHDANRVQAVAVGRGAALAACEGLDSSNSNRARQSFPHAPEVRFRTRISGGIGQAPACDQAGNLILTHGEPRLSKLDPLGRSLWSQRLPSEASCTPALLSNGSILVVTRDADALIFQPTGALQYKQALPLSDPRRRTFSIPTASGGALVASGSDLLQLDAFGTVQRQARARGSITAIAESGSDLVAVSENGSVELARATGDFELVGNLGGTAPEGGAVQAGKVLAVVDAHRLVALDLATGQTQILATDPALALSGPPALFENQGSALVADGGFVSLRARDGSETVRVSVAAATQAFDPATRALRAALLIGDRSGGVAAVRSASDALLLQADGTALRFDNSACLDPFRPTPVQGGIAFTCRSGQLLVVSDKAP
ncbi:MAG TPA: PQQ-binding-like beta-propeller repeat protein [Polyangiaceae bacterium]|nr:PQQ-binding-like beta-propeller repeat protein [Polyangiaceae bacterium]